MNNGFKIPLNNIKDLNPYNKRISENIPNDREKRSYADSARCLDISISGRVGPSDGIVPSDRPTHPRYHNDTPLHSEILEAITKTGAKIH